MTMMCRMILMFVVATLFSTAYAIPGTATFYTVYTPSACYGFQEQGVMIAAASDPLYNNGVGCGRRYRVTCTSSTNSVRACTGNSVVVRVVDRCPSPACTTTLDLSQEAFAIIANPAAGRINIDYVPV